MTQIITASDSDEIAARIAGMISTSAEKLVRIEGVCGSGKTTISRKLSEKISGVHIELDLFAVPQKMERPYLDCLNLPQIDDAIKAAINTGKVVVLDAVCLQEVAREEKWGRGLKIYVKRLSFNSIDPIWHVAYQLEDDPPKNEPHRSVHIYHNKLKPHLTADLIVEFPEDHHHLPSVPFSRAKCFDP